MFVGDADGTDTADEAHPPPGERRGADSTETDLSRYRELLEISPDAMAVLDGSGMLVAVSPVFSQWFGVPALVQRASCFRELLVAESRERFAAAFAGVLNAGDRMAPAVVRLEARNEEGRPVPVEARLRRLPRTLEPLVSVSVQECARQVELEQTAREAEERYRLLADSATDMVFCHDLDGNFLSVSRAGEEITGYSRAELMAIKVAQLVAPEDLDLLRIRARERIQRDNDGRVTSELHLMGKDGRRIPVEISSGAIRVDGRIVAVLGIARDITERKRLEEQLLQAQRMEAVGRLAGGVAHDFNNMLAVINGYSDLLLSRLPVTDPAHDQVAEIRKAGERAASLTRQLLAFSRRQIQAPRVLQLNQVISELRPMLARLLGEDVELSIQLDARLGGVRADPAQMEQVLLNLAANARDAMPRGGRWTLTTRARVRHPDNPDGTVFAVLEAADTGVGMDAATRAHAFEPFFSTKGPGMGTGLGLAAVYGIVAQSNGSIEIESEPGQGTLFRIFLPESQSFGFQEQEVSTALAATETVLLVEDEDLVRGLVRNILQMHQFRVLEAPDAASALETAAREPNIHLLLTDVVMPRMSGRELAERLTGFHTSLKVLYMSGHTDDMVLQHGIQAAGSAYLQKPFSPADLVRKIRELLDA